MYSTEELGSIAIMFVLILAAGFVVGKTGLLTKASKSGMTDLILYVTLPCTIVNSFKIAYDPSLLHGFAVTLLIAAISQGIGQVASLTLFRKQPFERRSVFRYGFIVCNSAFFGLSVISAVLHSAALPFAAVYLIPQRIAMWLLGVPVFSNAPQNKLAAVAKTLVHPSMIALYAGITLLLTQVAIPDSIMAPISAIGGCTMPLSMILVGSILAEVNLTMLLDKHIYLYCAMRTIAIPGIIFIICLIFGISGAPFHVSVMMAGMPAATTTSLMALRYGADDRLGSALITFSTVFFFVMLPVWLSLFALVGR